MQYGLYRIDILSFPSNAYPVDPHGHGAGGAHAAHGPEGTFDQIPAEKFESKMDTTDLESQPTWTIDDSAMAQILGIAILEFGVTLHSVLIGLTLAVDPNFKILFVVIVFHRGFIFGGG